MQKTSQNTLFLGLITTLILFGGIGVDSVFGDTDSNDKLKNFEAELDALDAKYEKFITALEEEERKIYKKYNVEYDVEYNVEYNENTFESDEDEISDVDEKKLVEIQKQYTKIMAEFGFVEPNLSDEKEKQMEAEFVKLDVKYDKLFDKLNDPKITKEATAKLEKQLDTLDAQYDKIYDNYGFKDPVLTKEQEKKLDEKLAPLIIKENEIYGTYYDEEEYDENYDGNYDDDFTAKDLEEMEKLDAEYALVFKEFGFVEPNLSNADQNKMEKVLSELDVQYDKIFAQMDNPKITDAQYEKLEKQLEKLDTKYDKVNSDFGFKYPELSKEQEQKLDERLSQFDDIEYYDDEYYDDEYYDDEYYDDEYYDDDE